MAFRSRADDAKWRFARGPMMAQLGSLVNFHGTWTNVAKKPYIFVIFQGGGGAALISHMRGI